MHSVPHIWCQRWDWFVDGCDDAHGIIRRVLLYDNKVRTIVQAVSSVRNLCRVNSELEKAMQTAVEEDDSLPIGALPVGYLKAALRRHGRGGKAGEDQNY